MTNTLTRFETGRKIGQVTVNGTSNIVVNDQSIEQHSIVLFGLNTVGGTVGAIPRVVTKTSGASFTVSAEAGDTSIYNYIVI